MTNYMAAYTKMTGEGFPGYINISSQDDGSIVVTVRSDPETMDGAFICGHNVDKWKPGRCTPGDDNCNNYCNMAPEKGKMQDHPLPCRQTYEGKTARMVLSPAEWHEFLASLNAV